MKKRKKIIPNKEKNYKKKHNKIINYFKRTQLKYLEKNIRDIQFF